jgi:hypothetical protein
MMTLHQLKKGLGSGLVSIEFRIEDCDGWFCLLAKHKYICESKFGQGLYISSEQGDECLMFNTIESAKSKLELIKLKFKNEFEGKKIVHSEVVTFNIAPERTPLSESKQKD